MFLRNFCFDSESIRIGLVYILNEIFRTNLRDFRPHRMILRMGLGKSKAKITWNPTHDQARGQGDLKHAYDGVQQWKWY